MSDKSKETQMKERGERLSLCNCHWSELGVVEEAGEAGGGWPCGGRMGRGGGEGESDRYDLKLDVVVFWL